MEFLNRPYTINIFKLEEENKHYISVKRKILDFKDYLPKMSNDSIGNICISFPDNDFFIDITELFQHIESFGAIDKNIDKICWENPKIIWIPENDEEHLSPILTYKCDCKFDSNSKILSKKWLQETIVNKERLGELYIPFSFYREGVILYHTFRYQTAYCSFYMMLEYFFCTKTYGIEYNACEKDKCLKICLTKTLEILKKYSSHYSWLNLELKRRNKTYKEIDLLFVLNRFRDELSHAVNKDRNRNNFRDNDYQSLTFIIMTLSGFVSIKKRLFPYVSESEKDLFLSH